MPSSWPALAAATTICLAAWVSTKSRPRRRDGADDGRGSGVPACSCNCNCCSLREDAASAERRGLAAGQTFALYRNCGASAEPSSPPMDLSVEVYTLLKSFDVDPVRGFLPSADPLQRLPYAAFQSWEAMADTLPSLLAVGQARKPLEELPEAPLDLLQDHRERMRALLLLCVFAHASVWGNAEEPQDVIPKRIAVPLTKLASAEDMPPLMTHTSLVLHNWHRLDPSGPLRVENLACNCRFLGGVDETWFYVNTVEIEARGGGVFGALLQAQHAIAEVDAVRHRARPSDRSAHDVGGRLAAAHIVLEALGIAQAGIKGMRDALSRMPVGCHPLIFYQRVRPFLSGWKANPTLPNGVLYEGVSSERKHFYGGSAAQSTLFPALDAALGVSHSMHSSNTFLLEMRQYMPAGHRRLLEHLADPACPSIRRFVDNYPEDTCPRGARAYVTTASATLERPPTPQKNGIGIGIGGVSLLTARLGIKEAAEHPALAHAVLSSGPAGNDHMADARVVCTAEALRAAYNGCLRALHDFRSTHLGIVGSYILQQQKRERKTNLHAADGPFISSTSQMGDVGAREDFAGGKGTGGTRLLEFLRPLKDDARAARLQKGSRGGVHAPLHADSE